MAKLNKQHVAAMVRGGMSQAEVARTFQVAPSAITQLMQRVHAATGPIEEFREHKAKTFEYIQAELVASLNTDDAKDAQSRIVGIGILDDKIRLERGQATSYAIMDIRSLFAQVPTSPNTDHNIDD